MYYLLYSLIIEVSSNMGHLLIECILSRKYLYHMKISPLFHTKIIHILLIGIVLSFRIYEISYFCKLIKFKT